MSTDIHIRAGGEDGPAITKSKAAAIVRSGGQVTVCAVDPDGKNILGMRARVSGGQPWQISEKPVVSWPTGANDSDRALAHAMVVKTAAEIAADAPGTTNWFDHTPVWVDRELAGLDFTEEWACQRAAIRYHAGDIDLNSTWQWLADGIKREGTAL